ncbi:hypothetical protein [Listeria sp. ILCC797]|uniref:hypothetical protein n=1 Tax=Listeria sp. ILCC797 TaxID=1918333 RepID=UPI000B59696D|nr:hypothetical protein [Listeria sp. ILCC797]
MFWLRDLIQHFYGANKPRKFVEVFSGGGTGADVAKALHLENSIHLDLSNGWNALQDDMPSGSDFVFSHPPYWDIIRYEWQRQEAHQGSATLDTLYEQLQHCKKAKNNQHVRAKLRQVLNEHINFKKKERNGDYVYNAKHERKALFQIHIFFK